MPEEIKTNQDLVDNTFQSIIDQNAPTEPQGGEPSGDVNNPANADGVIVTPPVVEPVVEPDLEPSGSEPNDVSDPNTVEPTETVEPVEGSDELGLNLFDEWDVDDTPVPEANAENIPIVDYSEIAKALEIEATTKEELVEHYKRLKEDALKAKDIENIPPELARAIDLAKQGQDYSVLFNNDVAIDHSKIDDRNLLMNENAKYFTDPDGKLNEEALSEYIDDMTEITQKIESSKIRESIDNFNHSKKEEKIRDASDKRQKAQLELQRAISETNDIKGFKVTAQHKSEAMNKISTGEAIKEMFYKADGTYDMDKLFQTYFIVKNFDKMKSFMSRRAKDSTRQEDFNQVSNANINVREHTPQPEVSGPKNLVDDYLESLKSQAQAGNN